VNEDRMESMLELMGIEVLSVRNGEIQARCPAHKERTGREDHNPSWFINVETGAHICFSCQFRGSFLYLIGYMNGYEDNGRMDFDRAKAWVEENTGLADMLERAVTPKQEEVLKIDPAMLFAFTEPPLHALRSRGLSRSAALECNLLWDEREDSWIIPVYDGYSGDLLGWQQKAYQGRFFKNQPTGMKKSRSLYGYRKDDGPVVLVESPLDVVRLRSLGIYGVASYGSHVSKDQLNLIKSSSKLIIALDNDQAGIESGNTIIGLMPELWFEGWFFDYSHTDQKDVGGMSKDEIMLGLENAKHYMTIMQGA